ncbi:MAG: 50S ribosomal protein L11 methyltransferase [Candidatus Limnocylindrus sp.]
MSDGGWLELSVTCDPESAEAISERLARLAPAGTSAEPTVPPPVGGDAAPLAHDPSAPVRIRAWVADTVENRVAAERLGEELARFASIAVSGLGLRGIGELQIRAVPAEEWETTWRAEFPVTRIGRIVIRPPWSEQAIAAGDAVVTIDPGQAFGTGLHPTTRLALAGIQRWSDEGLFSALAEDEIGILDVGTGSGILLAAALQLGAPRGSGIDVDPLAVEAAQRNLAQNGLAARSEVALGTLPVRAPAPLVVANLVAALQVELAPLLAAAVTPGGRLLTSGIFTERAEETVRAFTQLGMRLAGRWEEGEWVALEWTHG